MGLRARFVAVGIGLAIIAGTCASPVVASAARAPRAGTASTVSIGDVSVMPSRHAPVAVSVPVTLDRPHAGAVTVDFRTVSGSAVAAAAFRSTQGTLRFRPGTLEALVRVTVLPRPLTATPSSFEVVLSDATGALLGSATADVQLLAAPWTSPFAVPSGASPPLVSVGDVAVFSGATGVGRAADVPVTLSAASSRSIRVVVKTVNDTAAAGTDFARRSAAVTFRPGTVSASVRIAIAAVAAPVPDRQLLAEIFSAPGATVTRGVGHVLLLAEAPSSIVTTLDPGLSAIPLSADRGPNGRYDTFSIVDDAGTVTSSASAGNVAGNTRLVFWPAAEAPSASQESCATWSSQSPANGTVTTVQEGVALRVATVGGATRAITVLKNVFDYGNSAFVVALWDTEIPKNGFHALGIYDLSAVFGKPGKLVAFPWSICARAVGDVVQFEAWPDTVAQPAWGDTAYGATAVIPAADETTWDAPGVAGWYVGHLGASQSATYTSLAATQLP